MYSPRISEDLIPRLYRLRVAKKQPMTRLVREAIQRYLAEEEANIKEQKVTLLAQQGSG